MMVSGICKNHPHPLSPPKPQLQLVDLLDNFIIKNQRLYACVNVYVWRSIRSLQELGDSNK